MSLLPGFVRSLARGDGLIQLLALATIMLLCWLALLLRFPMHAILLVTYLLVVVRSTSDGRMGLPEPSAEQVGGTASSMFKLVVASWVVWTPLLLIYTFVGSAGPAFAVAALFTIVAVPAAVLLTSLGHSLVYLVNPGNLVTLIATLGFRYWQVVAVFALSVLGVLTISANLGIVLEKQPVPFIGDVVIILLAHTLQAGLTTVAAFSLGWTAFEAGDRLSLWTETDLILPQVPDASPRAEHVRRREDRLDDELEVDIELAVDDPLPALDPEAPNDEVVEPYEEPLELSELPVDEDNLELVAVDERPDTLESALSIRDAVRAVELYDAIRRASGAKPRLTSELQLTLADSLVEVGRYKSAATAYRAVAQDPEAGRSAPLAITRLARLLSGPLERPDKADALLSLLSQRYPDFQEPTVDLSKRS